MRNAKLLIVAVLAFSFSANAKKTYTKRKAIKTPSQSCEKAYKAAKSSPSTGTVLEATEACEKATEAACTSIVAKNSDGPDTGDARLLAASCDLSAAYGGNKAVNKFVASPKCEKAFRDAQKSPSTGEVSVAADLCKNEQDAACEKMVNESSDGPETGDGRLVSANCSLIAAHGAFAEVTQKAKASDSHGSGSASGAAK